MQPQKRTKVAVCVPSGRSWETPGAMTISALLTHSALNGLGVALLNQEGSVITNNRNDLVERAFAIDPDFIFFIDTDMVVPPDTLIKMIRHNLDIVGATYNRRTPPFSTLGHFLGKQPEEGLTGGVHEVDYLPGGCMLVKPKVFKTIGWPFFFETYQWQISNRVGAFIKMISDWSFTDLPKEVEDEIRRSPAFKAWLETNESPVFMPGHRSMSEDYNFCRKVRKHGYKIFCDLDITFKTGHVGTQTVTCVPYAAKEPSAMKESADAGAV